jgi:hypothetical protein
MKHFGVIATESERNSNYLFTTKLQRPICSDAGHLKDFFVCFLLHPAFAALFFTHFASLA